MQSYEILQPGEEPETRCYQALLFRGIADNTKGCWRAVFLDTRKGRAAACSRMSLDQAWYTLVWQYNAMTRDRDEWITEENWREWNILLTPTDWFDVSERRRRGEICPEAFTHAPWAIEKEELDRWRRWLH